MCFFEENTDNFRQSKGDASAPIRGVCCEEKFAVTGNYDEKFYLIREKMNASQEALNAKAGNNSAATMERSK